MMLWQSTASSSTFGAHPHHRQPLLHLNLMNSMPQCMGGQCAPAKTTPRSCTVHCAHLVRKVGYFGARGRTRNPYFMILGTS